MTAPESPTHIRAYIIFRDWTVKDYIQTKITSLMEKIPGTPTTPNSSSKATGSGTKKEEVYDYEIFDIDWRDPLLKIRKPSPSLPTSAKLPIQIEQKIWDERFIFGDRNYHIFLGGNVTNPDSSEESSRRTVDRFFLKVKDVGADGWVYENTDPGPESLKQVKLVQKKAWLRQEGHQVVNRTQ